MVPDFCIGGLFGGQAIRNISLYTYGNFSPEGA